MQGAGCSCSVRLTVGVDQNRLVVSLFPQIKPVHVTVVPLFDSFNDLCFGGVDASSRPMTHVHWVSWFKSLDDVCFTRWVVSDI